MKRQRHAVHGLVERLAGLAEAAVVRIDVVEDAVAVEIAKRVHGDVAEGGVAAEPGGAEDERHRRPGGEVAERAAGAAGLGRIAVDQRIDLGADLEERQLCVGAGGGRAVEDREVVRLAGHGEGREREVEERAVIGNDRCAGDGIDEATAVGEVGREAAGHRARHPELGLGVGVDVDGGAGRIDVRDVAEVQRVGDLEPVVAGEAHERRLQRRRHAADGDVLAAHRGLDVPVHHATVADVVTATAQRSPGQVLDVDVGLVQVRPEARHPVVPHQERVAAERVPQRHH